MSTVNMSTSKSNAEQVWTNNQTSIVARNGGYINVGETLTNTGAIVASENVDKAIIVKAKEIVVNNFEDKNTKNNIENPKNFSDFYFS